MAAGYLMGQKITELQVQKRNPNRVNLYLDGEFAFGLARITAAWLYVGQELSDERIDQLRVEDTNEAAYQKALKYISVRDRSETEVRRKLADRGVAEEITEKVLKRLQNSQLVDDSRFAQGWVENRSEFRPRSRRALAFELRQKGLSDETIQKAVAPVNDTELAYQAAIKQATRLRGLEWSEFRQTLYGFLSRRGFSFEDTKSATDRAWSELSGERDSKEHIDDIEVEK